MKKQRYSEEKITAIVKEQDAKRRGQVKYSGKNIFDTLPHNLTCSSALKCIRKSRNQKGYSMNLWQCGKDGLAHSVRVRGKAIALACAHTIALALTILLLRAVASPQLPLRFDVVSIRPSAPGDPMVPDAPQHGGYWVVKGVPTSWLINLAFETQPNLIVGMPQWARRMRYSVEARMPPSTTDLQLHLMLKSMLRDRFGMRWHSEMRPVKVAVLSLISPGPDLHPASGHCLRPGTDTPPSSAEYECGVIHVTPKPTGAEFVGSSVTLSELTTLLVRLQLEPVIDDSHSKALYDLDVNISFPEPYEGETNSERTLDYDKGIQKAFRKQLGIDLDMAENVTRRIPMLVIDHLSQASPN